MAKRLLSLNLAIVMLLSLLPAGVMTAYAAEDMGYANFSANYDGGEVREQAWDDFLSSNASLRLYQIMPEFQRDGYALTGYNSEPDGSGTVYKIGESIRDVFSTDSANIPTLYAQWQAVTGDHIVFRTTNGSTADGNEYYIQDGLDYASGNAGAYASNPFASSDGSKFIGWKDNYGKWYDPGDAVEATENHVVYAQWGGARIVCDGNTTGWYSGVTHSVYYEYSSEVPAPQGMDTILFSGWNSEQDGSGTYYTAGRKISVPADYPVVTVYAQWLELPESEYYYFLCANALASGKLREVVPMTAASETVTLPVAIDENSTLYGWFTSLPSSAESAFADELGLYAPGAEITVNRDDYVWAMTDRDYETIRYHGNGATTASGEETRVDVLLTSYSSLSVYGIADVFDTFPEDKSFNGWNTEPDGSGTNYAAGTWNVSNVDLYAQWGTPEFGLVIDGMRYDATQSHRGTGWEYYYYENSSPYLYVYSDYSGKPIEINTDVEIRLEGDVQGEDGKAAITVDGDAYIQYYNYGDEDFTAQLTGGAGAGAVEVTGDLTIRTSKYTSNDATYHSAIILTGGAGADAITAGGEVTAKQAMFAGADEESAEYVSGYSGGNYVRVTSEEAFEIGSMDFEEYLIIDGYLYDATKGHYGNGWDYYYDEYSDGTASRTLYIYADYSGKRIEINEDVLIDLSDCTVQGEDGKAAIIVDGDAYINCDCYNTDTVAQLIGDTGAAAVEVTGDLTIRASKYTSNGTTYHTNIILIGGADADAITAGGEVETERSMFAGADEESAEYVSGYSGGNYVRVTSQDTFEIGSMDFEEYLIIDGNLYDATKGHGGTGWNYYYNEYSDGTASRTLYIYADYSGKRIEINEEVSINLRDCTVQGEDGKAAITVDGDAYITCSCYDTDTVAQLIGGTGAAAVEVTGDLSIHAGANTIDGVRVDSDVILIGGAGADAITVGGEVEAERTLFVGADEESAEYVSEYSGGNYVRVTSQDAFEDGSVNFEEYLIIDGNLYDATKDHSGTGWNYYYWEYSDGDVDRSLTIYDDYSGKRIEINEDVSIDLRDCTVRGEDGKAAITVNGDAYIEYSFGYSDSEDNTAQLIGGAGAAAVEVTGDLTIRTYANTMDGIREDSTIILIGGAGADAIIVGGEMTAVRSLFAGADEESAEFVSEYSGEHYVRITSADAFEIGSVDFEEYLIIDGYLYDATKEHSGTGWRYFCWEYINGHVERSLEISGDYSGKRIEINEDVSIYLRDCTVQGEDGKAAITVDGNANIGIRGESDTDNSVVLIGGAGAAAVDVTGDLSLYSSPSHFDLVGGAGASAVVAGGDLFISGDVTAVGDGVMALRCGSVTIQGENPIILSLGSSAENAVSTEYFRFNNLTDVYHGEVYFDMEILPYETIIMGNGGVTESGEESVKIVHFTSSGGWLQLHEYVQFTNGDKLQLGWSTSQDGTGDVLSLMDYFTHKERIETVYAIWEDEINKGVVLENFCGYVYSYSYKDERRIVPVRAGDVYILPDIDLPLRQLVGWRGTDGVLYPAGTEITVTDTVYFTAEYRDVYVIIDGVRYDPNEDHFGDTWTWNVYEYYASLTLDSYNGGSILTNIDLTIYLYGGNVITGDDGYGIYGEGDLNIYVQSYEETATLTVTGGEGYEAIYAEGTLILPDLLTAAGGGKAALHGEEIMINHSWGACRVFLGRTAETAVPRDYVDEDVMFAYDGEKYIRIEHIPYILTFHGNGGMTADGERTYVLTLKDGNYPIVYWEDVKDIFTNGDETLLGFSESPNGYDMILEQYYGYNFSGEGLERTLYAIWGEPGDIPEEPDDPGTPEGPIVPTPPVMPEFPARPSTPVVPDTEPEADSTTTTVTDPATGTVTETTVYSNGAILKVVTTADGKQEISVSVPAGVEAEVTIPVENATAGMVAVIVHRDGTEEIIPYSIPCENGLTVTLSESAKLKIIDNAKTFSDVKDGDWFSKAVDFVSARGIMNGTGDGQFSHGGTTTRAMVWTMLARLSGIDTSGGANWYDKGLAWAMDNGISDGTNANGEITREQLVVMLWRLVGSPDVYDASLAALGSYADADDISAYAQEAMAWAIRNGIISGMGDGTLNPSGNATRAQVAQILMNFMTKI